METVSGNVSRSIHKYCAVALLGLVAASSVACSSKGSTNVSPLETPSTTAQVVKTQAKIVPAALTESTTRATRPSAQMLGFSSRDYGVSFRYPWQYSRIGPRAMAQGDGSLRPTPDGTDGQEPLVRIQVPKGFYPDTNYESGYFALSLNNGLNEEQCAQTLPVVGKQKARVQNINGTEYRWIETDTVGGGSSSRLRNYVTFANGTCYELELAVKTTSKEGVVREVNPEQVMWRLEAILDTVKVQPNGKTVVALEEEEEHDPATAALEAAGRQ